MVTAEALDIILRVQNLRKFQAQMREAQSSVRQVGAASKKSAQETGAAWAAMAKKVTMATAGIAAVAGVAGMKLAVEFDREIKLIETQAGRSAAEVENLRKGILDLVATGQVNQTPREVAQGAFALASVGNLTWQEVLEATKVASQGAAVGLAEVEETASALAGAYVSGIKGGGNFNDVMGVLNATVGAGNLRMHSLIDAMGTGVLPAAKTFGLSMQDVTGALALLSDQGTGAYGAMAQLATSLYFIGSPTEKARKALNQMGLDEMALARTMREEGLPAALQQLKDTLNSFSNDPTTQRDMLSKILPGGRGRVLVTLMDQLNSYQQKIEQINKTSGNFSNSLRVTQESDAYRIKSAWSSMQVELIKLGDTIRTAGTPALILLMAAGEVLIGTLTWIIKHLKTIAIVLSPLITLFVAYKLAVMGVAIWMGILAAVNLAAAIAAWIPWIITLIAQFGLLNATLLVMSAIPVVWIIAAIIAGIVALIAIIYMLIKHWDWVKNAAVDAFNWIINAAEDAGKWIHRVFEFRWIDDALNWLSERFQSIDWGDVWHSVWHFFTETTRQAINDVIELWNSIDFSIGGWDLGFGVKAPRIKDVIPDIPYLAAGGDITGGGAAVVGENGAELVHLPRGASVTPLPKGSYMEPRAHNPNPSSRAPATADSHLLPLVINLDGRKVADAMSKVYADRKARE